MGTRGAVGFRLGGVDKIVYNHNDSYPNGLGARLVVDLVTVLKEPNGVRRLTDAVERLVVRSFEDYKNDRKAQAAVVPPRFAIAQDGIWPLLEAGEAENNLMFLADSLFCEWAYVLNLDAACFEVYRGFITKPHDRGRYAKLITQGRGVSTDDPDLYYPVALVEEFPFASWKTWTSPKKEPAWLRIVEARTTDNGEIRQIQKRAG